MRIRICSVFLVMFTLAVSGLVVKQAAGQDPLTNLQVFPKDISRQALIAEMRQFAFALDVRCTHCHALGADGQGNDFASDENPNKEKARAMLRMVAAINNELLPSVPNRDDPPVVVTCKTCHRGTTKPRLLAQEMLLAAHQSGGQAAVNKFKELQSDFSDVGAYDFREWETNTVAEDLASEGKFEDALIIYSMNAERFPESASIWTGIGEMNEKLDRIPAAIEAYEKAVVLDARSPAAARLKELKAK
ncbi:MAG: c-type cytochrome [Bacteroidetes bacterium]|nr:c-type cytochrome [Bacteroidota bacterium]